MKNILDTITNRYGISDSRKQNDQLYFATCPKDNLVSLLIHLRDQEHFTHLTFLTAVDFIEQNTFQLTYMLHNYETKISLALLVLIDRENPVMESIHSLWEQARIFQQELREMFGIQFPGSPRIEENFALEGWDNMPPMRRDFDTKKYSEETFFPRPGRFTEDPREYMKKKLYPDGV